MPPQNSVNENEKCLFSNTQEFLHNIFIKSFKPTIVAYQRFLCYGPKLVYVLVFFFINYYYCLGVLLYLYYNFLSIIIIFMYFSICINYNYFGVVFFFINHNYSLRLS